MKEEQQKALEQLKAHTMDQRQAESIVAQLEDVTIQLDELKQENKKLKQQAQSKQSKGSPCAARWRRSWSSSSRSTSS